MFLVNSCLMIFSCGPTCVGQAIFRSYGCYFAEFLGDLSLVRLGLLALITCVGLRYGFYEDKLRDFSWRRALYNSLCRSRASRQCLRYPLKESFPDLPRKRSDISDPNPIMGHTYYTPSSHRSSQKSWNINHVSIGCGFRHPLRPD